MNENHSNIHVLLRGADAGGITKADVERRAGELALIRRGTPDYDDADLEAAARELLGDRADEPAADDAVGVVALSRDPSEPRSDRGHRVVHDSAGPEENSQAEELALQGVEEAQHDQMVEARKRTQRERRPDTSV